DRDVEADGGEPRLDHLLERCFAAPHREQLERDASAAQQPARRVGSDGQRAHRDVAGDAGRHGTVRDGAEAVQVSIDDLAASAGGPPRAAGNVESATKTQRRLGSCATKRNGPFPTGCRFHAARRSSARGIESSTWAGRIARSVSTSGIPRCAWANRMTTVESLGSFTNATSAKSAVRGYPVAGSRAAESVHATSRAVVGVPSCQRTPGCSRNTRLFRSAD